MNKRFYQMVKASKTVDIDIYGDITSWAWPEIGEVSAHNFVEELESFGDDVEQINVNINSYGGEVAEGLAIYNSLKRHKAHVTTYCDGFACSIASVIFMAGDERVMSSASLLMIHNVSTGVYGTADDLRKAAEDADVITGASKAAYLEKVNIGEDELTDMMDAETWITPKDALEMGFATSIYDDQQDRPTQSARNTIVQRLAYDRVEYETDEEKMQMFKEWLNELGNLFVQNKANDAGQLADEQDEDDPDNTSEDDMTDEPEEPEEPDEEDPEQKNVMKAAHVSGFFMAAINR